MSDEIRAEITNAAKALCHYPSGPSSVCSCCQGIPRCEMGAAIGEIMRLRAELATANTWRDTINSRLTSWMHPVLDGEEPHDALMRLLDFERRAFCDPAVSQDAADLVATARREGMEMAAQIAERCTSRGHEGYDGTYNRGINTGTMQAKADIAAAIRAAAKEGKP